MVRLSKSGCRGVVDIASLDSSAGSKSTVVLYPMTVSARVNPSDDGRLGEIFVRKFSVVGETKCVSVSVDCVTLGSEFKVGESVDSETENAW